MKLGTMLIAVAGVSLLPTVASAQTPAADLAYCRALSDIYVRYIGWDFQYGNYSRKRANNDAQVAVAKCQQGDAASAIPVLERELIANRFSLPARG